MGTFLVQKLSITTPTFGENMGICNTNVENLNNSEGIDMINESKK